MLKRFSLLLSLGLFILSGCVVPPSLSSTSDTEISSSQVDSSNSLSNSLTESIIDLKAYFQVVSITKQLNNAPRNAVIQVRVSGSTLTETLIIQGISLIANDFYEEEIANIGVHRIELTIQVFDLVQALDTSPSYGDALFMINETDSLIGIHLKEERIVLA
jgi:hypothetical protein